METYDVVQKLQRFIVDHDLPKTDIALYGIKCPYCGKSDRIRGLEDPNELEGIIDPEDIKTYSGYCVALSLPMGSLGCVQVLSKSPQDLCEGGEGRGYTLVHVVFS